MNDNKKYTIIIPTLNPTDKLLTLVDELTNKGFNDIIVVNDGSDEEYNNIFEKLPKSVKLLNHETNLGKGAALKTAIMELKNVDGFITVDSDGQHSVEDVIKGSYFCRTALGSFDATRL